MEETLDEKLTGVPSLDPKEEDFFVERLAQILLAQLEYENEHEKETRRIPETV